MTVTETLGVAPVTTGWIRACRTDRLFAGRGVAVLLPDGDQAALFLLPGETLFAVGSPV